MKCTLLPCRADFVCLVVHSREQRNTCGVIHKISTGSVVTERMTNHEFAGSGIEYDGKKQGLHYTNQDPVVCSRILH